jgi:transposase
MMSGIGSSRSPIEHGVSPCWHGVLGLVLACAEGLDNQAVAKKLRCSTGMVGKWRSRFLKAGLEGLYDEPRPGAPRKVSDDQVEQLVIQTLESTPRGETHWSTRGLAKATGLSRMTVSRIWHAFGLQPHRSERSHFRRTRSWRKRCGTSWVCT